jgi:hypothetical protein
VLRGYDDCGVGNPTMTLWGLHTTNIVTGYKPSARCLLGYDVFSTKPQLQNFNFAFDVPVSLHAMTWWEDCRAFAVLVWQRML